MGRPVVPPGVDDQRQRVGIELLREVRRVVRGGQRELLEREVAATGDLVAVGRGHDDPGVGVDHLVLEFLGGQRRVDRGDGSAELPGGEQRHDQLDAVRQLHGDDVTGLHTGRRELRRVRADGAVQLRPVPPVPGVGDADAADVLGRPHDGQVREVHGASRAM